MNFTEIPRHLNAGDLASIVADLPGGVTSADIARLLRVTPRTWSRWQAGQDVPWQALALLWLHTRTGRYNQALQVGNECALYFRMAEAYKASQAVLQGRFERLLAISDAGSANGPFFGHEAPGFLRNTGLARRCGPCPALAAFGAASLFELAFGVA